MGREMGGGPRGRRHVYLWQIHVNVWQKPAQYCKAIALQLKINNFLKRILKMHKMRKVLERKKNK